MRSVTDPLASEQFRRWKWQEVPCVQQHDQFVITRTDFCSGTRHDAAVHGCHATNVRNRAGHATRRRVELPDAAGTTSGSGMMRSRWRAVSRRCHAVHASAARIGASRSRGSAARRFVGERRREPAFGVSNRGPFAPRVVQHLVFTHTTHHEVARADWRRGDR